MFQKLAADDFTRLPYDVHWITGMALCAELGDAHSAAVLSRLLAPHADQFVTAGQVICLGSVARYLGRLAATVGRLDEADAHFAAAAAHTRIGASAWLAHTQLDWADLLLSRQSHGDVKAAVELLDQVLDSARQLGLSTVERRAAILIEKVRPASVLEDQT